MSQWLPPLVVAIVGSLLSFAGVVVQARGKRDAFDSLERSIDIRAKIREGAHAGLKLDKFIERQIEQLSESSEARRNPSGVALAVGLLIIAGSLAWFAASHAHWWKWLWLPAGFLFLLGLFGFSQDVTRAERDAAGHRTKQPKPADPGTKPDEPDTKH